MTTARLLGERPLSGRALMPACVGWRTLACGGAFLSVPSRLLLLTTHMLLVIAVRLAVRWSGRRIGHLVCPDAANRPPPPALVSCHLRTLRAVPGAGLRRCCPRSRGTGRRRRRVGSPISAVADAGVVASDSDAVGLEQSCEPAARQSFVLPSRVRYGDEGGTSAATVGGPGLTERNGRDQHDHGCCCGRAGSGADARPRDR